jgi:putative phosphoesterase
MKVAVIADIHSNLPALIKVLEEIGEMQTFCCGDLIGYNPYPNETIELIRERNIKSTLGNHDMAVLTKDTSWFNPRAAVAIKWTINKLKKENLEFLKSLPVTYRDEFFMVHGSPRDPLEEYVYEDYPDELFQGFFKKASTNTLILGHTHIPFIKKIREKLVFNPGAVGQPRDFDARASFAILDAKNKHVEVKRVEYDVEKVARDIIKEGLPEMLALRLFKGL